MTSYEFERALVYLAEQIIKTFGKDVGVQEPKQEPVEPLIKDEKVRKALRLLFDIWGIERVRIETDEYCEITIIEALGKDYDYTLEIPSISINGVFGIAELCGEEEE